MQNTARCFSVYEKWLNLSCDRRVRRMGQTLTEEDTRRVIVSYSLWLSLLVEAPVTSGDAGLQVWLRRNCTVANAKILMRWLLHTDVVSVVSIFKELVATYRRLPGNGSDRSIKKFLRSSLVLTKGCHVLYSIMFHLLYECARLQEESLLVHVNTLCNFLLRLQLLDGTEAFEDEAIEKYLQNEDSMDKPLGDLYYEYLPAIQEIIRKWFSGYDPVGTMSYQHSYGATAEVHKHRGTAEKSKFITPTDEMARVLSWFGVIGINPHLFPWARSLAWSQIKMFFGLDSGLPCDTVPAKYTTVPKGIDKRRGISMEETTRAWLQKLVADSLKNFMARRPAFHINLFDQQKNRDLASLGALSGEFATIDLSDASDLIRWSVVQDCFALVPDLLQIIDYCRAKWVTMPDGQTRLLKKHAPMGSALCFPVMCIILSAAIQAVQRNQGVDYDYVVYGDDIVCHVAVFTLLCRLLEAMGLKVNIDKSFSVEAVFRESCGVEAWKRYDVTPLRLSRKLDMLLRDIPANNNGKDGSGSSDGEGQFKGFVSLVNQLGAYGYKQTRRSLLVALRSIYPGVVFSRNENYGVLTDAAQVWNPHLKTRRHYRYALPGTTKPDTQGPYWLEYKVQDMCTRTRRGPDDLNYALKLERMAYRPREYTPVPEDRNDVRSGCSMSRLKWIWVPESLLSEG